MFKLTYLEPQFLRHGLPRYKLEYVALVELAEGIRFECPKCREHVVYVWFAGQGGPYNDTGHLVHGRSYEDITIAPSIRTTGGRDECTWHGFIENGMVRTVK